MDDQLKQRLWGATIAVALAVIFVPMLFDEKTEEGGGITASNVPPLPPEAQEREIVLPAMPDEGKLAEQAGIAGESPERPSYRIIPLDETPNAGTAGSASAPADVREPGSEIPIEYGADEGGVPDELPTRDSPLAKTPRAGGRPQESPAVREEERRRVTGAIPPPQDRKRTDAADAASLNRNLATAPIKAAAPKSPAPGEASASPAKSGEKRPATVRSAEAKSAGGRKSASEPSPKTGSAAAAPRAGSGEVKPSKLADAAKPQESVHPPPETAKSPASHKPADTRIDRKHDPVRRSIPAQRETAEVAKPAAPRPRAPDPKADTAAKKTPDFPPVLASAVPSASTPKPSAVPKATPNVKPAAAADKSKTAGRADTWVVRAGTYTSEAGAKTLVEKLRKQKFAAYLQKVQRDSGVIYRVQVGPDMDKSRAEQTRKRLETDAGIRGMLVSQH